MVWFDHSSQISQSTECLCFWAFQYLPSVRRAYSILCVFVTVHLAACVQGHPHTPLPAHLSLEWMTPGTLEDSHLAVAPLHFSLPLKHNSELSHHSPNKRYSSCIFNLLTDAIILYTPCSLILMQLLLFIAGRFSPPIILFESASPSVCVCARSVCAGTRPVVQSERADSGVNECKRRTRKEGGRGPRCRGSISDLLYMDIINMWSHISYSLCHARYRLQKAVSITVARFQRDNAAVC